MPRELTPNIIPYAENGLSSNFLFDQRDYYLRNSNIYPVGAGIPKPLDIWYQRPLWGKIDTNQRPVIPKKDNLVKVGDILVLDFVANAFIDMRRFMLDGRRKLTTSAATIIDVNNPVKGYTDVANAYNSYFKYNQDNVFKNSYLSQQSRNDIASFKDYIKKYIRFTTQNSSIPHTLTGYLLSPNVSPRCSGMIIEFARDKYDQDDQKWIKYLSSDFFIEYTKIAASFGFYINKHIPWSIAANLNSNRMKKYMIDVGISNTPQHFLDNYLQAEYISYISFKKYMFASYHSLITLKPKVEKINLYTCPGSNTLNSTFKTSREIFDRPHEFKSLENITYNEFLNVYPESFFLENYFKIKVIEQNINLTLQKQSDMIYQLKQTAEKEDIFDAIIQLTNFLAIDINSKYTAYRNKFF